MQNTTELEKMLVDMFAKKDRISNDGLHVVVTKDRLIRAASDVIETVMMKNADYGDAWQKHGIVGVLVRISDKVCRLEHMADGHEALVHGEHIQDTLTDLVGYGLLGLLWLRDTPKGGVSKAIGGDR